MNRILIVEDDRHLGPSLGKGLGEQGLSVSLAQDGQSALDRLKASTPDMLILDLGLPDCDGIELLQRMRSQGYDRPVLILTARDELSDKIKGFDATADDYLVKPFAFAELLARIQALLRRASGTAKTLTVGDITIDLVARRVMRAGREIALTPREFDLLAYLADHADRIVPRQMLAEHVWREPSRFTPLDNVIDVHVSRLRRKLSADSGGCPLQVVRGYGILLKGSS